MTFYVVNFRKKYRTYRIKRFIKQEFHPHFLFITSRQLLWEADCTRNGTHEFLIIAMLRVEMFFYCSQYCGPNLGQCSKNISWTKFGGNKKGIILIPFLRKPENTGVKILKICQPYPAKVGRWVQKGAQ